MWTKMYQNQWLAPRLNEEQRAMAESPTNQIEPLKGRAEQLNDQKMIGLREQVLEEIAENAKAAAIYSTVPDGKPVPDLRHLRLRVARRPVDGLQAPGLPPPLATPLVNGKNVSLQRKKAKLWAGAVPRLFEGLPAYMSKPKPRCRSARIKPTKRRRLSSPDSPREDILPYSCTGTSDTAVAGDKDATADFELCTGTACQTDEVVCSFMELQAVKGQLRSATPVPNEARKDDAGEDRTLAGEFAGIRWLQGTRDELRNMAVPEAIDEADIEVVLRIIRTAIRPISEKRVPTLLFAATFIALAKKAWTGLTQYSTILKMFREYPGFPWAQVAALLPADWENFRQAVEAVGGDAYYGFRANIGPATATNFLSLGYLAKEMIKKIGG
ncbi:hypothetical protein HPB52_018264 [Rhipicephalus sanguineus]|uniref:Uncharacterized protein n=1 Tax=Rhipicephalus sanguineus TaxID=34632 RepID=A0A9D4SRT6_RHISA|nr:hypothetical protein HPB52_018264 [Rhipicephalus sanguineus]